jgi:hypothetical protein
MCGLTVLLQKLGPLPPGATTATRDTCSALDDNNVNQEPTLIQSCE